MDQLRAGHLLQLRQPATQIEPLGVQRLTLPHLEKGDTATATAKHGTPNGMGDGDGDGDGKMAFIYIYIFMTSNGCRWMDKWVKLLNLGCVRWI